MKVPITSRFPVIVAAPSKVNSLQLMLLNEWELVFELAMIFPPTVRSLFRLIKFILASPVTYKSLRDVSRETINCLEVIQFPTVKLLETSRFSALTSVISTLFSKFISVC